MIQKTERLRGNRIIAEFMGKSFSMSHIMDYRNTPDEKLPALHYHSRWEWLIPVLEAIHRKGYNVSISGNMRRIDIDSTGSMISTPHYSYDFRGNKSSCSSLNAKECMWLAIVRFIDFYSSVAKKTNKTT